MATASTRPASTGSAATASTRCTQRIFDDLSGKGLVYRLEDYTHRYPVCWRCGTELIFRLVDEWFISMGPLYDKPRSEVTPEEVERSLRYQIMEVVDDIRWIPGFGYERELDWLRNMHDWMISKKRYYGLALPIWVCDDEECGHFHVVGSEHELKELATEGWEQFEGHSPHRPYVDAVKIACTECGGTASRIADVGNPWLDAGIVPFSTTGYRSDPEYWAQVVPCRPDHRELPRPVPQLVLQRAGHGHRADAPGALPQQLQLRHAAGRRWPADAQELGQRASSSTKPPTRWAST